jgi:hypothetical protein
MKRSSEANTIDAASVLRVTSRQCLAWWNADTMVRASKARAFPIPTNSKAVLTGAVQGNISTDAELFITDEYSGYMKVGRQYRHETVNHIALEYVRKGDPRMISTNAIENFWSLFKRGLIGSFHKVSVKHLRRYIDEFTFRFSNRDAEDLFALVMLNLVITSGIKYAELTAKSEAEPDASLRWASLSRPLHWREWRSGGLAARRTRPCQPSDSSRLSLTFTLVLHDFMP